MTSKGTICIDREPSATVAFAGLSAPGHRRRIAQTSHVQWCPLFPVSLNGAAIEAIEDSAFRPPPRRSIPTIHFAQALRDPASRE